MTNLLANILDAPDQHANGATELAGDAVQALQGERPAPGGGWAGPRPISPSCLFKGHASC